MANGQVSAFNVLVGYGDLFWAPYGTELPDFEATEVTVGGTTRDPVRLQDYFVDETVTTGGEALGWQYVGATQDGVELNYTPDYGEVEVDQVKDAIILFNQMVSATMSTNLAEATLENLLFAWGVADEYLKKTASGDVKSFSIGVPGEDPVERALVVISKADPYTLTATDVEVAGPYEGLGAEGDKLQRQRLYHARRVVSFEGSSLALRRTENTAYPVQFRLLPDPQFRDAEYGVIIDRAAESATPNPQATEVFTTNEQGV